MRIGGITSVLGFAFSLLVAALISISRDDIRFWDESMYLEQGASLAFGSQPGWSWNPLYTDGYWLLQKVFSSNIDVYFAGRAVAAIFVVGSVWMSVRLFANATYATSAALVMALLPITYIWPSVAAPSAALLVFALAIVWRWSTPGGAVAAGVLVWVAAAIRPEFVWAASAVSVIAVVALVSGARSGAITWRRFWILLTGLTSVPVILISAYGNPWDTGTRSWEAFTQHYEYRFATSGDDPWQIDAPVVEQVFPGASSVSEALLVNPPAFVEHVLRNVIQLPISLGGHLLGLGGLTDRANLFGLAAAGLWLLAIGVGVVKSRHSLSAQIGNAITTVTARKRWAAGLISAAVIVVAGISMITIYPRPHYLLFAASLILVMSGISLSHLLSNGVAKYLPMAALIGLAAIAVFFSESQTATKVNSSSLNQLNAMNQSWRLLTPEKPIDIYLDKAQYVIADPAGHPSFIDYVNANKVNVIFDGVLLRQAPYAQLPGFEEFLTDPRKYGFAPVLPDSPFLVRTESP